MPIAFPHLRRDEGGMYCGMVDEGGMYCGMADLKCLHWLHLKPLTHLRADEGGVVADGLEDGGLTLHLQ
jgi:hypothetical protein